VNISLQNSEQEILVLAKNKIFEMISTIDQFWQKDGILADM